MTLILGLECADGLILASDGQVTIGTTGQHTKGETDKLNLPWNNIAWGASGHEGVIQRVDHGLRTRFPSPNTFENKGIHIVRDELCKGVAEIVRPLFLERHLAIPSSQALTSFLFVGHVPQGSFILEIGADLIDADHIKRGYSAIGSGDIFPYFALAVLGHFDVRKMNLSGAKLIAYRVVDDAIKVAAEGLGKPIQMIEVKKPEAPGKFASANRLGDDDLRLIESKLAEWKGVESDTLAQIIGIETGDVGADNSP